MSEIKGHKGRRQD